MINKSSGTKTQPLQKWIADLNLLFVAIFWGVNMPIMKFALGRMDEYLFNALRLSLSAAVLGLCVVLQERRTSAPPRTISNRRYWINIVLFAILTGFAYQVCFLLGIRETTAGNTALIMSAIPMWTAILAFLMLRERLSRHAWIGLIVAMTGVLIVTLMKDRGATTVSLSGGSLAGNLLVSAAAFSWAFGSVLSRPIMNHISPLKLAFYSIALTLPLHFAIAWRSIDDLGAILADLPLVAALLYSGIFSTGLAYGMWNYGVKHLGVSHAAGFQNLVPLIAIGASWLLISETPYAMQLAGGGLIIAGLLNMRRNSGNRSEN